MYGFHKFEVNLGLVGGFLGISCALGLVCGGEFHCFGGWGCSVCCAILLPNPQIHGTIQNCFAWKTSKHPDFPRELKNPDNSREVHLKRYTHKKIHTQTLFLYWIIYIYIYTNEILEAYAIVGYSVPGGLG